MVKIIRTESNRLQGNKYLAQKKYSKALKEYLKVHAEVPDDPSTNITLGEIYSRLGNRPAAVSSFTNAADKYRKAGFFSKAIVLYQKICRIDSENLPAREQLVGLFLLKRDDSDDAFWQRKHEQSARDELRQMALIHEKKNRDSQAMRYYQRMISIDPFDADACIKLAEILFAKGQRADVQNRITKMADRLLERKMLPEARKLLEAATTYNLDELHIKTLAAHVKIVEGDVDQAVEDLQSVINDEPTCSMAHRLLGQAYLAKNALESAKDCLVRAFNLAAKDDVQRSRLAELLHTLNTHLCDRGLIDLSFESIVCLVDFHVAREAFDKAVTTLKQFIKMEGNHLPAYQKLLAVHRTAGHKVRAGKLVEEIHTRFLEKMSKEEAIACLDSMTLIDPNETRWHEYLAHLTRGDQSVVMEWNEAPSDAADVDRFEEDVEVLDLSDEHQFTLPDALDPPPADVVDPQIEGIDVSPWANEHSAGPSQLPGREILMDRLTQALKTARRNMTRVVILLLHVDRSPHLQGLPPGISSRDLNLEAENRLLASLRQSDTVGRLAPDEFAIILQDVRDPVAAERVARKILSGMAAEFLSEKERGPALSCSIGVTVYPDDADDLRLLLQHADTAMERAKSKQSGNFAFYTKAMDEEAARRVSFERDMYRALDRNEFLLYYQPILSLDEQNPTLMGVEALLRWQHPELGFLLPAEFIAQAEETKLMQKMGTWVLRSVLRQVSQWYKSGYAIPSVSINISKLEWRANEFETQVKRAIDENGLPASVLQLRFESSQSVMLEPGEETISKFQRIRYMGVSLTVDDFGKGTASLISLSRSPIDMVKIDRSFVEGIPADEDSASITRALVKTAQSLGMKVIAEGIETEEQLGFLRDIGCDFGQGYLFSEPIPPDDVEERYLSRLKTKDN